MLTKKAEKNSEEIPEHDEGWWAAVLSDEEAHQLPRENSARPASNFTPPVVNWELVQTIFEQDEIITLKVHGFNRGGLLVQGDGVQGFVPVSHLVEIPCTDDEEERKVSLAEYVGSTLHLKVIECDPSQERIVLSERAALAGEGRRKVLFKALKPGGTACGTVTNVTEFGVFVDLGGVEGLIHVSELSWGRVQHPGELLKIGQTVNVLVVQVNEESSRIALSLKRLFPNPWETLTNLYQPGDTIPATITSVAKFGAFARLEEGIEGLIHISSIHPAPSQSEMLNMFYRGQQVQVRILHIDPERRRLGLGLVQVE